MDGGGPEAIPWQFSICPATPTTRSVDHEQGQMTFPGPCGQFDVVCSHSDVLSLSAVPLVAFVSHISTWTSSDNESVPTAGAGSGDVFGAF